MDLTDTLIGGLIFRVLIPAVAIIDGGLGVFHREINVRGAPVHGLSAILYGMGFVFFGFCTLGMPPLRQLIERGFDRSFKIRIGFAVAGSASIVTGLFTLL